jgi:DNA polymerase I-like protein with 3'-5' exonuclease and polymerase domains
MLAVDTETTGLDWFDKHYPFLATASDYDRDVVFRVVEHPTLKSDVTGDLDALTTSVMLADALIFHNAPFDIHMMVKYLDFTLEELLSKPIYDTSILARIVLGEGNWVGKHQGGFGLKELATHYIDADAGKYETAIRECMVSMGLIKKVNQQKLPDGCYYEVWLAYPEIMEEYALMDTRYTYDLYHVLMDMASDDHKACFEMECQVQPTLIRMEHKGLRVDPGRSKELYEEFKPLLDKQHSDLMALAGDDFNPDGNDVIEFLSAHGVEIEERTPTGQVSTAAWVLERYAGNPAVDALLDYRRTEKMMSTYIIPIQDREVVHTNFWQVGAGTGRMSSSKPNMQNIPSRRGQEFRSVFVARPGHKLIVADYRSVELRILCYYVNDERLMEMIAGGDFFSTLGTDMYGTEDQSKWPVPRDHIKNGVYASVYAAGGATIARTIGGGMTAEEGKELKAKIEAALGPKYTNAWRKEGGEWLRQYPDLGDGFVQRCRKTVKKRGWLRTLDRRILRLAPDDAYKGPNWIVQGSAAGIMKVGLHRAAVALEEFDAYPLLVVHDEIVAESPERYAEEALWDMRDAMASAADLDPTGLLQLDTSGVICENYGQAKGD